MEGGAVIQNKPTPTQNENQKSKIQSVSQSNKKRSITDVKYEKEREYGDIDNFDPHRGHRRG
ncbi:hypothetical protein ES708_31482 [subsurface metagenome]